MATILIVDDDPQVLGTVRRILSREAHSVVAFSSGPLALNHAIKNPPDLIILDIIMPDIDGLTLCKSLRAAQPTARVPILFLTVRSSAQELAEALDCGGDDCLRKPFASSELAARVRALLRRAVRAKRAHHADPNLPEVAPAAALPAYTPPRAAFRLIPERREAQVDGRSVALTPTEMHLLRFLAQYPGVLIPADRLLQEVWGYPPQSGDPALVRTHIRNLRQKIERDPAHPAVLLSMHGRGYTLNIAHTDKPTSHRG